MKSSGTAHASKGIKVGRTTSMERVNFDLEETTHTKFKQYCLDNKTDKSTVLRKYVKTLIS